MWKYWPNRLAIIWLLVIVFEANYVSMGVMPTVSMAFMTAALVLFWIVVITLAISFLFYKRHLIYSIFRAWFYLVMAALVITVPVSFRFGYYGFDISHISEREIRSLLTLQLLAACLILICGFCHWKFFDKETSNS